MGLLLRLYKERRKKSVRKLLFVQLHTQAFGHFVVESELLLKKARIDSVNRILFYRQKAIANEFWWKQVQKNCVIVPRMFGRFCDRILSKFNPSYKIRKENFSHFVLEDYSKYGIHEVPGIVKFTKKDVQNGEEFFRTLEMPKHQPLIGLCLRDSAYDETFGEPVVKAQSHRNIDSEFGGKIVRNLIRQQTSVIRFGNINYEIFPATKGEYIDLGVLSGKKKSSLPFFLASKVNFFISTGTGVDSVACALRKRIYNVNFFPIGTVYSSELFPLYLPQDYVFVNSGKKLTLSEIFSLGIEEKTVPDLKLEGIEIRPKSIETVNAFLEVIVKLERQVFNDVEAKYCQDIWNQEVQEFERKFNLERFCKIVY